VFLEVLALERTLGRLPRGEFDVRRVNSSLVCTIASRSTSSLVISSTWRRQIGRRASAFGGPTAST